MKVNVESLVMDLEHNALTEQDGKTPIELRKILIRALVLHHPSDEKLSGDDKFTNYQLASKIADATGEVELTPEEIVLLKKRVGLMYGTVVVGPVYKILNG